MVKSSHRSKNRVVLVLVLENFHARPEFLVSRLVGSYWFC